jgi:hypothetical protein
MDTQLPLNNKPTNRCTSRCGGMSCSTYTPPRAADSFLEPRACLGCDWPCRGAVAPSSARGPDLDLPRPGGSAAGADSPESNRPLGATAGKHCAAVWGSTMRTQYGDTHRRYITAAGGHALEHHTHRHLWRVSRSIACGCHPSRATIVGFGWEGANTSHQPKQTYRLLLEHVLKLWRKPRIV